jgi:thiamine pyrophosphate-dependent acetolactate synthase large subunit-like protein
MYTHKRLSYTGVGDGHAAVAQALATLGVRYMFGVVGIPVTPLASAAQVHLFLTVSQIISQ